MKLSAISLACCVATLSLLSRTASAGTPIPDPALPTPPSFSLRFTLPEFSFLHSAAVVGVNRYGGEADFRVKLIKEGEELFTDVTLADQRLLDVWALWMAERTSSVVGDSDLAALSAESRVALALAKSVNAKLTEARQRPQYAELTIAGTVKSVDKRFFLDTPKGGFELMGPVAPNVAALVGRSIRATGSHRLPGGFELARFVERHVNTLEVFTMSQCPFGKRALASLIDRVRSEPSAPRLDVHYIFYRLDGAPAGSPQYTSLHGDAEIEEDLVQIVVRDTYPDRFQGYIVERSGSDAPWAEVLRKAGLGAAEEAYVRERITNERETLIAAEYAYVFGVHGIRDGSPTFVWESERIDDLNTLPWLRGLDPQAQPCTGG